MLNFFFSACSSSSCSNAEANARLKSLPIAIKTNKQTQPVPILAPQSSFASKIYPPTHLSLNNSGANVPTESFAAARCDSKDSGIVTPTGQQTAPIFPFSPCSPNAGTGAQQVNSSQHQQQPQLPFGDGAHPRKCLVDGTTGKSHIILLLLFIFFQRTF